MIYVWTDANPTKVMLPVPAELEYESIDIDKSSGRTDDGLMHRNRVRRAVRKIKLKWRPQVNINEHYRMIKILEGLPEYFYCQFPSPRGEIVTMECYHGDLNSSLYRYDGLNDCIWKDCAIDFIER